MNELPKWIKIGWILGRVFGWPLSWFKHKPCLLVIHLGSLGDGLLFTGAIRELRKHEQGKQIVLVVSERAYPLFQRCPHVNHVVAFAMGADLWSRTKRVIQASRLFARRYENVLSPNLAFFSGAPHVDACSDTGHLLHRQGGGPRRAMFLQKTDFVLLALLGGVELKTATPWVDPCSPHQLDRMVHFLQAAGFNHIKSRLDIWPEIYVTATERDEAAAEVNQLRQHNPDVWVVAVCAGARFKQKDWGDQNFIELLVRLAKGRSVAAILLGGEHDKLTTKAIEAGLMVHAVTGAVTVLNKAGRTGLNAAMALIEQADACIGNDTFGLHVAIAVGTPSVVVMWGGDHERWVPWGDPWKHRMVRSDDRACFGCRGECIHPEYRCTMDITVDDVLKEVLSLPCR